MEQRKNINRGYMQLRVWQDARELYILTWNVFRCFPYELKRVASQQIASIDSIHRNIAEGYCRRGIKEYLQHLNIATGSAGESVSALHVYGPAGHITEGAKVRNNGCAGIQTRKRPEKTHRIAPNQTGRRRLGRLIHYQRIKRTLYN